MSTKCWGVWSRVSCIAKVLYQWMRTHRCWNRKALRRWSCYCYFVIKPDFCAVVAGYMKNVNCGYVICTYCSTGTNVQLGMWCWRLACAVGLFTLCIVAPGIKRRFASLQSSFRNQHVSLCCWFHLTMSTLIPLVSTPYALWLEESKLMLPSCIIGGHSSRVKF